MYRITHNERSRIYNTTIVQSLIYLSKDLAWTKEQGVLKNSSMNNTCFYVEHQHR